MDADSLAVVMAPNLIQPNRNINNLHDHTLNMQRSQFCCFLHTMHHSLSLTGVVKLLIEGAERLSLVPPEVWKVADNLELEQKVSVTKSLDSVLKSDGSLSDLLPKERKATGSSLSGQALDSKLVRVRKS